jgi:FkbM family methyltransferase
MYYGQPWKRRALCHFYGTLVGRGDLAFDIGAHVGRRSHALIAAGATVVAVEPQQRFADYTEKRFTKRWLSLVRSAIGRQEGTVELEISSRHPTVSSVSSDWIANVNLDRSFRQATWDRSAMVEMTTLDRLIEKHGMPRFCKIDVEGGEADILHGLSKPLPLVAFDYIAPARHVAPQCVNRLERLGDYRFNLVEGESHIFSWTRWRTADAMRDHLASMRAAIPSGDIYACLQ